MHCFLEFIIDDILCETGDVDRIGLATHSDNPVPVGISFPHLLPLNKALLHYNIPHSSFVEFLEDTGSTLRDANDNDVEEYYCELRLQGALGTLVERAVHEVFYILFSNRALLLTFNEMMTRQTDETELDDFLKSSCNICQVRSFAQSFNTAVGQRCC